MTLKEVYINKDAYFVMEKHAFQGAHGEVGGFLLGRPCIRDDDMVTWVMKAVPGNCISTSGHVVIKSSTYDRVWNEMEHDDLIIVGWYHTHPGMGIFLSGTDVNTMSLYYPKPYQIAIVIDPINRNHGVFGWQDEESKRLVRIQSYIFIGEDHKKYFHGRHDNRLSKFLHRR